MNKSNKKWLTTIAFIAIAVILWLLFKRNPAISKVIENALPFSLPAISLPESDMPDINIELDGYDPRDYPLPSLPMDDGNRGTSCNFCLQSRVQISPPSPPAKILPPQIKPVVKQKPRYSMGSSFVAPSGTPYYSATGIYLGKF